MGSHQQFSLYWNDYVKHITSAFDKLRCDEDLIDVTLSCEGKRIRAHKMLLSACSTYFKELFKENPCQHPVIIFRNVKYEDLSALVDFMYQGEVNVTQDQLTSFLTTAEMLAVQGLCDGSAKAESTEDNEIEEVPLSAGEVERKRDPSNGVWQKNENQRASIAGTSAASSIPYFPEKRDSESPPASKRRKRQSNTPNEELEHKSHRTALNENCDSDPIEIIEPEEQADVKLETVEYEEAARDNVGYGDSNLGMNAVAKTERDQLRAVSQLLGHDLSEMYSGNSQDSSQQQPAENMSLDISQMLQKPGPSSGDNHSQDSLQDIVHDNAGYELFADLCLADFLLTFGFATTIRFHVKSIPWYVSDALTHDVKWTADIISQMGTHSASLPQLSSRWNGYLDSGLWELHTSDFWTLPYEYCVMQKIDPGLYEKLSKPSLLIFKGDLNYRKLMAGINWPPTESFTTALQGFQPTNIIALRAIKSEAVCGLQPSKFKELAAINPKWRSCGDYGLVQYSEK